MQSLDRDLSLSRMQQVQANIDQIFVKFLASSHLRADYLLQNGVKLLSVIFDPPFHEAKQYSTLAKMYIQDW